MTFLRSKCNVIKMLGVVPINKNQVQMQRTTGFLPKMYRPIFFCFFLLH